MTLQEIYEYSMEKNYAWEDMPFNDNTVLIKLSTHYFVTLFQLKGEPKITVKCTPEEGMVMREMFPGAITRGWHCQPVQQPYNNTIHLNGSVPDEIIKKLIDLSYDIVMKKLTKKERSELSDYSNN